MIVSHRHRFIFLKTRKTAGSSIEVALSRIAGEDAIVTPLNPPEPGHEPRNYAAGKRPEGHAPPSMRRAVRDREAATAAASHTAYFDHMPAFLVRARLGDDIWSSYFRFCFERNPWDKVASMYSWRTRDWNNRPPLSRWLFETDRVFSDWPIYSIDDECAVDGVGRYEALSSDLTSCLRQAGIALDIGDLPRAKSGFRRRDALYSRRAADHVGQVFEREVEHFGYQCPPQLLLGP